MPVLLHRLSEFVVPSAIPESANLLPVHEVDIWDGQSYAITELPLAAVPALHPGSAALGALRALSALHAAGQVHGGLNAGQLWQVGREVRLAGAGLPWKADASAAEDLSALGQAIDSLGARPAALDALETMTAARALTVLEAAMQAPRQDERPPGQWPVAPSDAAPADIAAPVAVGPAGVEAGPTGRIETAQTEAVANAAPEKAAPEEEQTLLTISQGKQALEHHTLKNQTPEALLSAAADTPTSYRSAEDIVVIGEAEEAAAADSVIRETPPMRLVPAPIQIGFEDLESLPAWTPEGRLDRLETETSRPSDSQATGHAPAIGTPADGTSETEAPEAKKPYLSASPGDPEVALGRTIRFVPASVGGLSSASAGSALPVPPGAGPVNARTADVRGQLLRIGWEEDHSWRVVKSGPERRSVSVPRLPSSALNRTLLALLLLALLGGLALWSFGQTGIPAAACCTLKFTVSGSSQPVKVTLVQGPPGSSLQPGALIGTAPGVLNFPSASGKYGAPGRYTLRFTVPDHGALNGTVTVPSSQPFGIILK